MPDPAASTPVAVPLAARLVGVHVVLGGRDALCHVDLDVPRGLLTVLAGPNGAGKSTLVEVLAGVRETQAGRVEVAAGSMAFVPQRTAVPERLPVTVREVVAIGTWGEAGPWRRVGSAGRRRIRESIELLGLGPLAARPFAALSGGERQRALLAQGLARGADLLLLDEPTTGLDSHHASRINEAVDHEVARGTAVVCASHDAVVLERAERVVWMESGRVVSDTRRGDLAAAQELSEPPDLQERPGQRHGNTAVAGWPHADPHHRRPLRRHR